MEISRKQHKILKWASRIAALLILGFGLPFYFGYGNPLPFASAEYTLFDNVWLSIFPVMFIGLAIGWKWPRIGGFVVVLPLVIGTIIGLFIGEGLPGPLFGPLGTGILYLITGYGRVSTESD